MRAHVEGQTMAGPGDGAVRGAAAPVQAGTPPRSDAQARPAPGCTHSRLTRWLRVGDTSRFSPAEGRAEGATCPLVIV
ncbi:hypothetical protein ABZS61_24235 [Streptomyces sp. NPDC005566]|uniref:hypothetical protein n=1 Tax=Streptomyces sp. NPDC005566 TaxID=3156886 RepID=UPI0033B8BCE6